MKAVNLNTKEILIFDSKTAYETAQKLIYYLNINHKKSLHIDKTVSGKHLYVIDGEDTWAIGNYDKIALDY